MAILPGMTDSRLFSDEVARTALAARLVACGITPTAQRLDIAEVVLSGHQHVAADQVLERVNRGGGAVSKATVYNTLGLFAERGLLCELVIDASRVFYDSNTTPHCHFYNVDDGTLTDMALPPDVLGSLPATPAGTYAEALEVVIRIRNRLPSAADEAISENFRL